MSFNAQVWVIVLVAIFGLVSGRPEQHPSSSSQEQSEMVSGGVIQELPQDEAARNSRAYMAREGNEASTTMTDEDISGTTTENLNVDTERIMTTETSSDDSLNEKQSRSNIGDEQTREALRTLLNRISRIDHTVEDEEEDSKQGVYHIPRVIQLDNSHLGIEGRTSNKFEEMDNHDEVSQSQDGKVDSALRDIMNFKISQTEEDTKSSVSGEKDGNVSEKDDDSTRTSNKIPSIGQINGQESPALSSNYPAQYNLDAMQQLLFNPTLKDIFKYNPAFDYLSKVAHSENIPPSFNKGGSKLSYDGDHSHSGQEPVIRRKIQYHQMVFQPNPSAQVLNPMFMRQTSFQHQPSVISYYPGLDYSSIIGGNRHGNPSGFSTMQQTNKPIVTSDFPQQTLQSNVLHYPSMHNQMSPAQRMHQMRNNVPQRAYDDYFPVIIHNPFNMMWSAFTNIIEYGPEADVCKTAATKSMRNGRNIVGASIDEDNIELNEDLRFEIPKRFGGPPPFIRRMKVRRGGVAIAGPGGIATAGSGGTAIVGPGGTAYTKEDGTAIVGPGGRLVHVPEFPPMKFFNQPLGEGRTFQDPPGSKLIAMGPVIYYSPRSSS